MEVHQKSGALGAEITGVDLARPLDGSLDEKIHRAFLDHQVIFFRGQSLNPHEVLAFASRFGTPADYPFAEGLAACPLVTELVKTEHETINFGGEWHSDTTYLANPPRATVLFARQVPRAGGDTVFADMYGAFESLSEGMKALLAPLRAVSTAGLLPREKRVGFAVMTGRNVDKLDMSAEHPVVRTHDETGRRSLYINETHTARFSGMTREESAPLIEYLTRQAVRPELCFRLRWRPGTLTLWDNRCTQALRCQRLPRSTPSHAPRHRSGQAAGVSDKPPGKRTRTFDSHIIYTSCPKMSVLGNVKLRAMSSESPCQGRYGASDAESYRVSRLRDDKRCAFGREIATERLHVDALGVYVDVIEFDCRAGERRAIHVERVIGPWNHDFVFRARQKLKNIPENWRRPSVNDDIVNRRIRVISAIVELRDCFSQLRKPFGIHATDELRISEFLYHSLEHG